ncbi:hypothetical protein ACJD0Z_04135 [Flavobacteriaceae bacterium M23B6Z8]
MKRLLNLSIVLLLQMSCNSQDVSSELRNKLNFCIDSNVNSKIVEAHPAIEDFDLYNIMIQFENTFFRDYDKKKWLELINELSNSPSKYDNLGINYNKFLERKGLILNDYLVDIIYNCPDASMTSINNYKDLPIYDRMKIIDSEFQVSKPIRTLYDFIEATTEDEFNHIEFKTPIFLMYVAYLNR